MILVAAVIRLQSPGPVFFRQLRSGYNGTTFNILKFRTMYVEQCDISGTNATRPNDSRVTPIGRFLRRWSLDELPQLFNVLKGEMSFVGPRPHPLHMLAKDIAYRDAVDNYAARHRMKPGITGLAQVRGNRGYVDNLDKAIQRIEFDTEYINNWSPMFDLYIILLTVKSVLTMKEAY
jgi:lipopolysaccharide/colanic/teichoic acid biosynthesis glycosyltransferase